MTTKREIPRSFMLDEAFSLLNHTALVIEKWSIAELAKHDHDSSHELATLAHAFRRVTEEGALDEAYFAILDEEGS